MSMHKGRVAARTLLVAAVVAGTLTGVGPAYADEGEPVTVSDSLTVSPGGSGRVAVLLNDTSVDAIVSVAISVPPVHGTASFGGDRVLTYTAPDEYHGDDYVGYVVRDADGDEATGNVSITVVDGNPVTERDYFASTGLNDPVIVQIAEDTVPDGFGSVTIEGDPSEGNVDVAGDQITYTPDEGFQGSDYFYFLVFDEDGDSAFGSVQVRVHDGLDVDAQPDEVQVEMAGTVVIDALGNDDPGDLPVTLATDGTTSGAGATLSVTVDNEIRYEMPAPDFRGFDSFDYQITDDNGDTEGTSVSVLVYGGENPVKVSDDEFTVPSTGPSELDVLANDSALDGPAQIEITNQPGGGSASVSDGVISYTPSAGARSDALQYEVTDADGDAAYGWVELTVNRLPVAVDDAVSTTGSTPVSIDPTGNDSDPDGSSLSVAGFDQPSHGSVTKSGNTLTYTAESGYAGSDAFLYDVRDTYGDESTATVTVTVNAVPQPTPTPPAQIPTPPAPTPTPPAATGPVAATLTASLSASAVPLKTPASLTGTVTPASGVTLTLRKKAGASWTTVGSMAPTSTRSYAFTLPTGTSGASTYQVTASGAGITTATSTDKTLTVFGAGITSVNAGRAESLVLRNAGKVPVALGGMTLKDKSGTTLVLPKFTLKVGKSVTVFTGKGRSTATKLYVGKKKSVDVWSTHDVARLLTAGGVLAARLKY